MYKINRFYKMGICFAFFSEFITIYPLYNLIFKDHGILPMNIAWLLIIQKVSKMLFDLPTGIMADRMGRRSILALGVGLRAAMLFLFWAEPSFLSFGVAIAMWGISMSCMFGNESAYIYDFLRIKKTEDRFPLFMGMYYAAQNIATVIACYIGGYLYEYEGASTAVMISMFMMLVAVFFLSLLPRYTRRHLAIRFPGEASVDKVSMMGYLRCIKNPKTLFFVILLAVYTALFLFFFDLSTLIMGDCAYSAQTISLVVSAVAFCRVFSNIISGFVVARINVIAVLLLSILILGLLVAGSFIDNKLTIAAVSLYLVMFTLIDLTITSKMQVFISSQLRATIMSISNLFASLLLVFLHLANGYLAQQASYLFSAKVIAGSMTVLMVIATVLYCLLFGYARNRRS